MNGFEQINTQINFPTVDVIIVARDESADIGACLAAIAKQTYRENCVKVWVVDNGSKDDTAEIARQHGATVIECASGYLGALRNVAIKKGQGELIAFLDAHCLPRRDWLNKLVRPFDDVTVGGCQGGIDFLYQSLNARQIVSSSRDSFWENTICGKGAPYPSIVTGNAIYSREAVERAGLFDQSFIRGEDIDLAWRVALLGYRLVAAPEAIVSHMDRATAFGALKKVFFYGVGGAQLTHGYGLRSFLHGAAPFRHAAIKFGYSWGRLLIAVGCLKRPARRQFKSLPDNFRPVFFWKSGEDLRMSRDAIFWRQSETEMVVVDVPSKTRIKLEDCTAMIFEGFTRGDCLKHICQLVRSHYGAEDEPVENDVEDLMAELKQMGIMQSITREAAL